MKTEHLLVKLNYYSILMKAILHIDLDHIDFPIGTHLHTNHPTKLNIRVRFDFGHGVLIIIY